MQVVSAREFRANQTNVLRAAREGQPVMLTSRVGVFMIVPVESAETKFERALRASAAEVKAHMEGRLDLPNARDIEF